MRTTLCRLMQDAFTPRTRLRGDDYHREGRVSIRDFERDTVMADVRGSEMYEVTLRLSHDGDSPEFQVGCTCPYYADQGPCKHIWATMRTLDEAKKLQLPADTVFDFEHRVVDDAAEDAAVSAPWDSPDWSPRARTPAKPPTWRATLSTMRKRPYLEGYPPMAPVGPIAERETPVEIRYELGVDAVLYAGRLLARTLHRATRRDGTWGKWKILNLAEHAQAIAEEDFLLATALAGVESSQRDRYYAGDGYCGLDSASANRLLPRLCATGRLFATTAGREFGPLTWDTGEPWTFTLAVSAVAQENQYRIQGWLVRGAERCPLSEPLVLLSTGWVIWLDRVSRLAFAEGFDWIVSLREHGHISVPAKEVRDMVEALVRQPHLPPLELPDDLQFNEVRVPPVPHFALSKPSRYEPRQVPAHVFFQYDGHDIPAESADSVRVVENPRRLLVRDQAAERRHLGMLTELGLRAASPYYARNDGPYVIGTSRVAGCVRKLVAEGWKVTAQGRLYRAPGKVDVAVDSGVDWFELRVGCDYDGQSAALPALLEALRQKQDWVALGDGSFGLLPEEWLKKYGAVAALGQAENERVRFTQAQAGLLDAWLAAQPEARLDEIFMRVRKEMAVFTAIQPASAPQGFMGTLRAYQEEGLGWLHFLQRFGFGGCLADDMGLGKTVQVLALLAERKSLRGRDGVPPSLVVAPRSLIFNWLREAQRFAPALRCLDHTGVGRNLVDGWADVTDVVFTTYGTLRRDIGKLQAFHFDYVILDESQAIKNAGAQTAKAVRLLRGSHRLALSGTPIENHLGELWSLFDFLNPGLLGAAAGFDRMWVRSSEPEQRAMLARALRPFILRRTKSQVAKDLPARQEDTQYCTLPPSQRKLYDELRAHYRQSLLARVEKSGLAKSKIHVLEALLRLRQAACHPALVDPRIVDGGCAKFETLLPQIEEVLAEGHKALVFSQFTGFLALLRKELDDRGVVYEYLDGRTKDRQARVERFQSDKACPLFLISLKAGGLGLNLTAADYVFLLDPWWNPAVEAQAIDRAHRIGQVNNVMAYRLIAKDTVEEKVLELQAGKRALADAIIGADNALIRNLTREDLSFLLG
ncbi:MAG: DEAD/DEAH box helicase [Verrucomicrobia bacterium]|nr:DEAD/DEAH box helicase [Verrucomicrobiota bacterium]